MAPPDAAPVAVPPAKETASEIRAAPTAITLKAVKGAVELRRGGEEAWRPATSEDSLSTQDSLRTLGGEARLVAGDHVVRLVAGTEVTVGELTADLTSFLLSHGLVGAEATGDDGRVLEVRARDGDASARTSAGRFRMSNNGEGTVAVGALDGEVRVTGKGASVVLRKGERTVVRRGEVPDAPQPFGSSLLLKVAWPERRETNQRVITVTGRTETGALVFALGERVPVGEDGTFAAKVRLREGTNRVQLEALDVAGNNASSDGSVVVDSRGAESRFKTDNLWRQ